MKAIHWKKYGSPEHLEFQELPTPIPKENEVLVQIKATSVNRTDCAMFYAKPFFMRLMTGLSKPKSGILGTEFSGIVAGLGGGVEAFQIGDAVFGLNPDGLCSHAEYMVIDQDSAIALKPSKLSFEEAGACTEGAHYAQNMINKVSLKRGDKVIVNGATGGIGSAALQLAKYYGAEVTAVGNTKNLDLLKSLGADFVINYEKEDFNQLKGQYDYIFDTVGKSTFFECKHLLKPTGVYESSELGPYAQNIFLSLIGLVSKWKKVKFPFPKDINASLLLVKKLMESGQMRPVIDRTYSMEDVGKAFEYVAAGNKTGNVAITL
ncbi:MAG: NADPH:quinone reductase-like Zn-dependent oxidoreductase [Arcticibacterium sp.]|jgi:NADPH:quinone reductase-like Zn-dependent oxidoreductase